METLHGTMRRLEADVNKGDASGLRARWKSGRHMLTLRQGNQLRHGVLDELAKDLGVHRSELTARMKFAEKFPTDDELTNVISKFKTWFAIKQQALTNSPRIGHEGAHAEAGSDHDNTEKECEARGGNSVLYRILAIVDNLDAETFGEGHQELLKQIEDGIKRVRAALVMLKAA